MASAHSHQTSSHFRSQFSNQFLDYWRGHVVTCPKKTNTWVNTSVLLAREPLRVQLQYFSTQTNIIPPAPGWTAVLWLKDGKRKSISSSITLIAITLYDFAAKTTNYHSMSQSVTGEKTHTCTHTSRVIHWLFLTAAVRYLKPLLSSALMGVEMSFAPVKETELKPNNIIQDWWGSSQRV